MMQEKFDLIVVGGGMVGLATAVSCSRQGLRVAIVEPNEPALDWPAGIDLRVSAITRASQAMFESAGVWPQIVSDGVSAFEKMKVWDSTGNGLVHFDSAELGEPYLGHIIENRIITKALYLAAKESKLISVYCPAKMQRFTLHDDSVDVVLDNETVLTAALLVGADGTRSKVRESAGIAVYGWEYAQKGVVATVKTERPHEATAWQRFLPTGPLAFLPLYDGRCSIVWSLDSRRADEIMALDDVDFVLALENAFEKRLGHVVSVSSRAAFPLRLQQARHYIEKRIALVGDAAHTIHPLAGQGVNLGFNDVTALTRHLSEAHQAGRDIGSQLVLRRYEREQRASNLGMMAATDGFYRLFGNEILPLRLARNAGMNLVNQVGVVKNLLARRAMGLPAAWHV